MIIFANEDRRGELDGTIKKTNDKQKNMHSSSQGIIKELIERTRNKNAYLQAYMTAGDKALA